MLVHSLSLWFALTLGNFIYQAMKKTNWEVAAERSFFQGVAIALFAFSIPCGISTIPKIL